MSIALVLSGGAPNSTLMSGALTAMAERGVRFDVISTSGAGAIVGLLFAAPRNDDPVSALRATVEGGVNDLLYDLFPVNFKVFKKPGPLANLYRGMLQANPFFAAACGYKSPMLGTLPGDWAQLVADSLSPSSLSSMSKGLCEPVPWISELVDFERLAGLDFEFYINAYNITDRQMENFGKQEITLDHFHAAMAFPFLYPPKRLNGKYYFEGASKDALNFKPLVHKHPDIDTIVVFDILGIEQLIHAPRNLYDAWIQSIIVPLVANARDDLKLFEAKHNRGKNKRKLLKINYSLPKEHLDQSLDWSESNLRRMFDIGYRSGIDFITEHEQLLLR
ncbi:MAG: patatin-like phospholipase family protein [Ectothiorhodospiraceae bacterium]|nr:patatin-like phospholipase family protein [Ectothiorhodospiraceae bacterium]